MSKRGILLVNLGSPDSTEVADVRRYLDEFLMDKRVIDYHYIKRAILIKGIILRTRPGRTSEAYRKIWWPEGSPLIVISERQKEKLRQLTDLPVSLGMRYGNPSIKAAMQELADQGVTEISVVPLYPQYAMSSTETVVAKAREVKAKYFPQVRLHIVRPFYADPDYIRVMAENIRQHLPVDYDKIVFSFHGIPERHFYKYGHEGFGSLDQCIENADPVHNQYCYLYQADQTVKAITKYLNLPEDKVIQTFQSRLGREKWVEPYTDEALERLPKEGVKKLVIICPAFVADCLETLEEIEMEGARTFRESGGTAYHYIPCLNENEDWLEVLKKLSYRAFEEPYDVPMMIRK